MMMRRPLGFACLVFAGLGASAAWAGDPPASQDAPQAVAAPQALGAAAVSDAPAAPVPTPPVAAAATPAGPPIALPTGAPVLPGAEPPPAVKAEEAPVAAPKAEIAVTPPVPVPDFALEAELSERLTRESGAKATSMHGDDRRALAAFYAARQFAPAWVGETGFTKPAQSLMASIRKADDYGLEASAFRLPSLGASPSRSELADADFAVSAAALKYARHARGGRTDPAQLSKNLDRRPQILEPLSVIKELAGAARPGAYLISLNPRNPQFEKLRLAYLAAKAGQGAAAIATPAEPAPVARARGAPVAKREAPAPSGPALARKLLVNMEQWRWMPEDMGRFNVWVNIPEYTLRVTKGDRLVHTERVVVGLTDKQTPVFSEDRKEVIFHPFWGVPDSIKRNELLPSLARGGNVLAKNGLRMQYGGRDIDPSTVDWATSDIRRFLVYQPPGGANVLGVVKFRFPNKHDVYMHDTPSKSLFNASVRTFSHGCMRVRDPVKLAEVILAEDKAWAPGRVQSLVSGGPQNNQINLSHKIPVHVTYFTAWVDADGTLRTANDIYGHESRIQLGIEGKAHLIPQQRDVVASTRPGGVNFSSSGFGGGGSGRSKDWMKSVFGF